jgi:hypothetical protein
MPKRPDSCEFVAPLVRQEGVAARFEPQLMGFVVTCQVELSGRSRRWWAERLDISPSTMSKMAAEPSVGFVEHLDLALAEESPNQRLPAKLSDLYSDIRVTGAAPSVVDWLAMDAGQSSGSSTRAHVGERLLSSEVALKRCQLRLRAHEVDDDVVVRRSVQQLLTLASGPYGASVMAHQRVAEFGMLVPALFFDVLTEHFDRSPAGFRLLRTLDRFVNVWRLREEDADLVRLGRSRVDLRLTRLLRVLAKAALADRVSEPYPGREWSISLARNCLRNGHESELALDWLAHELRRDRTCDRAKLYAAYGLVEHGRPSDYDEVVAVLGGSSSDFLATWAALLVKYRTFSAIPPQVIVESFCAEIELVRAAVGKSTPIRLSNIQATFASVLAAAILTPDGRLRRNLIESVVAAGMVGPAVLALVEVYPSLEPVGVRESVLFLLSRLRQPDPGVVNLLHTEALSGDEALAQIGLWGLGDLYNRRSHGTFADGIDTLLDAASGDSPQWSQEAQIAAAHALAVIAHDSPDDVVADRLQRIVGLHASDDKPGRDQRTALCRWGREMYLRRDLPDPFVDPTELLMTRVL